MRWFGWRSITVWLIRLTLRKSFQPFFFLSSSCFFLLFFRPLILLISIFLSVDFMAIIVVLLLFVIRFGPRCVLPFDADGMKEKRTVSSSSNRKKKAPRGDLLLCSLARWTHEPKWHYESWNIRIRLRMVYNSWPKDEKPLASPRNENGCIIYLSL